MAEQALTRLDTDGCSEQGYHRKARGGRCWGGWLDSGVLALVALPAEQWSQVQTPELQQQS